MKSTPSITPIKRCPWPGENPVYVEYHDTEWGVPVYDDRTLFEFLILEGAQAGLSWLTVLKRREGYRKAFCQFDAHAVSRFTAKDKAKLLKNSDIIRNRLKIESTVNNAKAFLNIQKEFGSFSKYQWQFVNGKPIRNTWKTMGDVPAKTPVSDAFSKDLKKRGFNFVGSTIIYAHMQATGMVNDHLTSCFCYDKIHRLKKKS